jgi:mono/diheme cytochrome c family protein
MPRRLLLSGSALLAAAVVALVLAPSRAAQTPARGTAPAAGDAAAGAPGLALTIEPLDGGGAADTREVRMVALYVPAGQAPSPFVPAGRFRATWEGSLNLKLRERYAFQAEGRGKLTVLVDDKPVFEAAGDDLAKVNPGESVRLKKGANKLVVKYESPAEGEANVRLIWSQKGVPAHPLPAAVFTHDPAAPATARGRTLREGRQLIADLRCTKCHATAAEPVAGSPAFPELAMDAPSFKDIGARLNRDWMAAWIHDPRAVRDDAHMPKVFHEGNLPQGAGADADTRAADVAAYLATLGSGGEAAAAAAPTPADVEAGQRLYTALACAACHVPPGSPETAAATAPPRVSHDHVAAKFTPAGLKQYLLDPDAHYVWNPMPNFRLSEEEAAHLSAYLMSAGTKQPAVAAPNLDKADAQRGEALLASAGCVACHTGVDQPSTLKAAPLAELAKDAWARGCLAADEVGHGSAPYFKLSDGQRQAITAFAETDRAALARDEPGEFASRQHAAMRCANCHPRDGQESALVTTLAPEHDAMYTRFFGEPKAGEAPDTHLENGVHLAPDQKRFPLLTWAGEKLRPEWATAFIAGEVAYKPRPYLRARMPGYKARAAGLAAGLAAQHGRSPTMEPYPPPDESLVPAGEKLIGAVGGFSCVQCHAVGGAQPLAPFEAPAIDFMHVSERMRKDFYHRWMYNPIALDPTTKMPSFADGDGKTALRDTLDGDAVKQFEAIWQYLLQGKNVKRR